MSELLVKIKDALVELEEDAAVLHVKEALEAGVPAQDIIVEGLQGGMKVIGDRFASRKYFLPELIMSAEIMKNLAEIVKPYVKGEGEEAKKAVVVIGSAKEDIHDIGKNIVALTLEANGFEVYDVGVDVPSSAFIAKAQEVNADIIAISALLSTVVGKVAEAISDFKTAGLTAKVIVGGAAFTQAAADAVGADAYALDAWAAQVAINELLA
ncbi:cobalamin B12-binding domain-containing protein [Candidatus Formimonas warabiya]|uniref:Cobalamin-binding protein n=1 Tax=Formimonas warabiya TaxID=1761012 RepID=A0A3G1L075_FORW1|nr:cobalamin-dependent protein [Candidatus Formimonas warabiya]ATW28060.1 hypothetical protein DCMF_27865 [Candidatus Formimonas warabiya]